MVQLALAMSISYEDADAAVVAFDGDVERAANYIMVEKMYVRRGGREEEKRLVIFPFFNFYLQKIRQRLTSNV